MNKLGDTPELLRRAQSGDACAVNDLLAAHAAPLRRWASGRLPRWARGLVDTADVVQEALFNTIRHLASIRPERAGGLEAYLRAAVLNRVRDEIRKASCRPARHTLDERQPSGAPSPLEVAIGKEALTRYEQALLTLPPADRKAVIGHFELGFTHAELATMLGKPSANAARMALQRALVRLAEAMDDAR